MDEDRIREILKIAEIHSKKAALSCRNFSMQPDFAQEIAVHVFLKISLYRSEKGTFQAWANRVAARKACDLLKSCRSFHNRMILEAVSIS